MSTGATLDQRVTALEQLVQQLGSSEALVPNYLTAAPDGTTGAAFTGSVSVPEGGLPIGVQPAHAIGWRNASATPAHPLASWIEGIYAGGSVHALVSEVDGDPAGSVQTQMIAGGLGPLTQMLLTLKGNGDGTSQTFVLGGADGKSSFLQLTTAGGAAAAVNWGVGSFVGNGTNSSGALNVPHGLPRTPGFYVACILGAAAYMEAAAAADANQIHPAFITPAGTFVNLTTYFFYWAAIG